MRSLAILAGALVLGGCQPEKVATEAPVRPVTSVVVRPFGAQATSFTGVIAPKVSTDYSFQILGQLVERAVGVGDVVEQGDVLASLDATVQEQDVEAAEAALASARASVANASGVFGRQSALRRTDVSSQATVDDAEQALQAARSAEVQATASLDKAREQQVFATLFADAAGVVTAVSAEPGQVMSPGEVVVTVARPAQRDAVIDLPGDVAAALALGTSLPVSLELDASITAAGTVREIAPLADAATRSRRVKIALDDPPDGFRLGSIVRVSLPGDAADALALPASAILSRDGATFVWVLLDGSDIASLRKVDVRPAAGGAWAVIDGLGEGTRVAAAGVNTLVEGQHVKIEEAAP